MASWDKDRWNGQTYQPVYQPTPAPDYADPSYTMQPPQSSGYATDQKNPYEGGRFAPKKRIHDPFFLVFFVLQASVTLFVCFRIVLIKISDGQFAGFVVVSALAISEWVKNGGLGGGVGGDGNTGSSVTLNRCAFWLVMRPAIHDNIQPHCVLASLRHRSGCTLVDYISDPDKNIHETHHAHYPYFVHCSQHVSISPLL